MTTGKQIPGLNLDALNFPTNITANTISISETQKNLIASGALNIVCLLYTSPSPRDLSTSRMPSSA